MDKIEELIIYENENTSLDFKRDEYKKEDYASFLKDVISMANATTQEERYIIVGLKPKSPDDRGFKGIEGELTDPATYQQLVHENIEPELSIEYFSYKYKQYQFGVFKITNCDNPPYLMKKDYGSGKKRLYRGEGFIRKGTHQPRLKRKDYDKFINQKIDSKYFKGEVEFYLTTDYPIKSTNEIKLVSPDNIERPSQKQKERIKRILEQKKKQQEQQKNLGIPGIDLTGFRSVSSILSGKSSYEERDIPTLEKNLKNVEYTYYEDDCYEIFEKNSNKCNISIFNKGHNYIEDTSIVLKVPKLEGLYVPDRIYSKPERDLPVKNYIPSFNYPEVIESDDYYIIEDAIGDIKHQKSQNAFGFQLRIFATTRLEVNSFSIILELFAKNIKNSISREILIKTK